MNLNCNGVGDCDGRFTGQVCTPHPDNQHCRKFFPITFSTLSEEPFTQEEIEKYENT